MSTSKHADAAMVEIDALIWEYDVASGNRAALSRLIREHVEHACLMERTAKYDVASIVDRHLSDTVDAGGGPAKSGDEETNGLGDTDGTLQGSD